MADIRQYPPLADPLQGMTAAVPDVLSAQTPPLLARRYSHDGLSVLVDPLVETFPQVEASDPLPRRRARPDEGSRYVNLTTAPAEILFPAVADGARPLRRRFNAAPAWAGPIDPIAAPIIPTLAAQPFGDMPLRRRYWRQDAFSEDVEPIDTPAYLMTFWLGYAPTGPFQKRGLLPALQQAEASPAPIVEILVVLGAWRAEPPLLLRALRGLIQGTASVTPIPPSIIAEGIDCLHLVDREGAYSTLVAADGAASVLADPSGAYSTLIHVESC